MLHRHAARCRLFIIKHSSHTRLHDLAPHRGTADNFNALVYTPDSVTQTSPSLPLHNLRIAIKDNICTADMPTTCSSTMLSTYKPPFDATAVRLLREAGAPLVGKANCDEFGMGSLNLWSVHGPALNPRQPVKHTTSDGNFATEFRAAGGSSGGSAAAVAAGLCDAALGTDTGGSVRLPASYCGVVGMKPSYGIISRWGVISYADSLDCVGVLGKNANCVQDILRTIAQYDHKDPTAAKPETRQKAKFACQRRMDEWATKNGFRDVRIGIPQEYFPSELNSSILEPFRKVIDFLRSRGVTIVPVSLPSTRYALSAYYVIASAEASSNLARYDGIEYGLRIDPAPGTPLKSAAAVYAQTRSQGFGPEVQRRILLGTYALTADAFDNYFLQAQRVRNLVKADFDHVFSVPNVLSSNSTIPAEGVDVLLHPSAIRTAPPLILDPETNTYKQKELNNSLDAYLQDVLTVPASLAGLPAMSVPAGAGEDGWPVGVSVVGQWGCDEMVMRIGREIESSTEMQTLRQLI